MWAQGNRLCRPLRPKTLLLSNPPTHHYYFASTSFSFNRAMDQDTPSKEGRSVSRLLAPANSPALRNLMYACDRCRSKKIKCTLRRGDVGQIESVSTATTAGPRLNVLPCSKCEANNAECTYGRTRTERAIPKGQDIMRFIPYLALFNYRLFFR